MAQSKIFFIASVLLATAISCTEEKKETQEIPTESFRGEVAATPVNVALAEQKSFDYLINASGKLEAVNQVKIVLERQGILEELYVKEGDYVEKGKVIAKLDDTEIQFQLEKARIQKKNAEASYQSDILSFQTIMESGDTAQIGRITDQLKAKSGFFTAEVDMKEAEMNLRKSTLLAPITGKVADLNIKKGSYVSNGDDLMEIVDVNRLILKVNVLESDINQIKPGQKAEIFPVSGGMGEIVGTVISLNPKVDENGLVQVNIQVSGNTGLLPGMNARAVIRAPQNNSLVVPKQALVYRSGRPVVFTIENNESKWNYVEVGKDNGQEVEILTGIEPNSTVITSNNLQLGHQVPIQIAKD
jgi:RND family efflux transporter MFP subunit